MRSRISFYTLIILLTAVDAFLISNPNLLGKLGFVIYKFSYLRTFPRALVTVSIVVGAIILMTEGLVWISKRQANKKIMKGLFLIMSFFLLGILIKTELDFQSWSYSHTGYKLRYGAYLLPVILLLIVVQGYVRMLRYKSIVNQDLS